MKGNIKKDTINNISDAIKEQLKKQYLNGMLVGSKTIAKVVVTMILDGKGKEDIEKFCESVILKPNKVG